jgi:hypothetical protein
VNLESPFGTGSPNLADSGSAGLTAPFNLASAVGSAFLPIGGATVAPGGSTAAPAAAPGLLSGASSILGWFSKVSINDVIGLILGLLLVIAVIFLFKPVTAAATTAVKAAVAA